MYTEANRLPACPQRPLDKDNKDITAVTQLSLCTVGTVTSLSTVDITMLLILYIATFRYVFF